MSSAVAPPPLPWKIASAKRRATSRWAATDASVGDVLPPHADAMPQATTASPMPARLLMSRQRMLALGQGVRLVEERTIVEGRACTTGSVLEPPSHHLRSLDERQDLRQPALGDRPKALARRRVSGGRFQEQTDLV